MALVVLNLVAGFHALGTLLAVGMMILPSAASRFWAQGVVGMIAVSIVAGMLASVSGLLLSYHFSVPSGPAIILIAGGIYAVSIFVGPVGGLIAQYLPGKHLEA